MDINTATQFVEKNSAMVILCDIRLNIIKSSAAFNDVFENNKNSLFTMFPEYESVFKEALAGLSLNLPYLSTNFEYKQQNSTIIFLPLWDNSALTGAIVYFFSESGIISPLGLPAIQLMAESYRSPITAVLNLSATLASKLQLDEKYDELKYINAITQNCYTMLRTSSSVHDYYLLKNKKYPFSPKPVILNDLLYNIKNSLALPVSKLGKILDTKIIKKPIPVMADERLFTLSLLNIIKNSCIYSAMESTVTISLSHTKEHALIKISDEGIGIAKENMRHIFEPFFTVHEKQLSEEQMGLGLGLSIASEAVKLHGGRIAIQSKPNEGTTIAITLPIYDNKPGQILLNSGYKKYTSDKYSDLYILFSDICDINFF